MKKLTTWFNKNYPTPFVRAYLWYSVSLFIIPGFYLYDNPIIGYVATLTGVFFAIIIIPMMAFVDKESFKHDNSRNH